jgi:ATP-binding cassette subfamily F protein uup
MQVPQPVRTRDRKKLSFNEQRELETLPARIEALEAEERALQEHVAAPDFYKEGAEAIRQALARAEEVSRERQQAYARWAELDERSQSLRRS